jgi:acyl carrier protein
MAGYSDMPEGLPGSCPLCEAEVRVEVSAFTGDVICPRCRCWLCFVWIPPELRFYPGVDVTPAKRKQVARLLSRVFGTPAARVDAMGSPELWRELGGDSLDMVELVMELEEEGELVLPEDVAERIHSAADLIDTIIRESPD